jgi:hypothetical protein
VSAQETPAQVEDSLTLMCGSGVLDDAATLLSAAAVDGVILACVAGTSTRADLAEARLELERAGARLLGAVLVG